MATHSAFVELDTPQRPSFHDVTDFVKETITNSNIHDGIVVVLALDGDAILGALDR